MKYFLQNENIMGFLFVCCCGCFLLLFFLLHGELILSEIYTPKGPISHWDNWFQPAISAVIYATSVWTTSNSEDDNIICKKALTTFIRNDAIFNQHPNYIYVPKNILSMWNWYLFLKRMSNPIIKPTPKLGIKFMIFLMSQSFEK